MACKERKTKACACTYDCEHNGHCCECVANHREQGEFPACFFSPEAEKTYDRSFAKLVTDRS